MRDLRPNGRALLTALLCSSIATLGACTPEASITALNNAPTQLSITLSPGGTGSPPSPASTLALEVGDTADLVATALDAIGQPVAGAAISWSTTNGAVASVEDDGTVAALSAGSAQIVAEVDAVFQTVDVTVTEPAGPPTGS